MTLGEIIKNYRTEHNLSLADFSKLSGMSKSYLSILERNMNPSTGKSVVPSIKSIQQAAIGMHMPFDTLFDMVDYVDIIKDAVYLSMPTFYYTDTRISEDEKRLLEAYRLASETEKLMVLRLLQIEFK